MAKKENKGCGKKYKMFKDNLCFITCGFIDSEKRVYLCPNCEKLKQT